MSKNYCLAAMLLCSILSITSCSSASSSSSSSESISDAVLSDSNVNPDEKIRATRVFESNFTSINAETGLKVRYTQGSPAKMVIEGTRKDVAVINAYINNGCLHLDHKTENKKWNLKEMFKSKRFSGDFLITVTAPDVTEFDCSTGVVLTIDSINNYKKVDIEIGTGGILNAGAIKSPAIDIDCSTGAVANINGLETENADIDVSTGATITLTGKAVKASMDASTGASINAGDFICEEVTVDASTGATVSFNAIRATTDTSVGATVNNTRK